MSPTKKNSQYLIPRPYAELGEYLQAMRLKANLTQRQVSDALSYSSAQFISNFERGIAAPPLYKLKILLKMYSMPLEKVLQLVLDAERQRMIIELGSGRQVKGRAPNAGKGKK